MRIKQNGERMGIAFLLFVGLFFTLAGQEAERVEGLLKKWVEVDHKSPGVVLGIIDGQGQRIYTRGLMAKEGSAMAADTLFEIGSVTKVFTALLMAEMAQRGELDPLKSVESYLPAGTKMPRFQDQPILLEHLATQTSALPRMPSNFVPVNMMDPYADYTATKMMDFLGGYTLPRQPGSKYDYSNLGFGLLGHVLSVIGKKDYGTLIDERILIPLGMRDTLITVPPEKSKRLATAHGWNGQPVPYWRIPGLSGAGALHSTLTDLLTFLAAHMGLRHPADQALVKALAAIQEPYLAIDETGKNFIARGWHLINVKGQEYFFHDGGTGGFRSMIGFRRDKSWGVAVLVNSANDCAELALALAEPQVK